MSYNPNALNNNIGRAGGSTLIGGTGSGENLTLSSTSHATKGKIIIGAASAWDEANQRLGIGTLAPDAALHIHSGVASAYSATAYINSDDAAEAAVWLRALNNDVLIRFTLPNSFTAGFSLGLDDAFVGKFKISASQSLGTSDVLTIDPQSGAGTVTWSLTGSVPEMILSTDAAQSALNIETTHTDGSSRVRTLATGTGDSYVINVNASTTWTDGIDTSDSNRYRICNGVMGTQPAISISTGATPATLIHGDIELDGALNHDGTTIGLYGTTPVAQGATVADPAGGVVIDAECRTAVIAVIDRLNVATGVGLIAT